MPTANDLTEPVSNDSVAFTPRLQGAAFSDAQGQDHSIQDGKAIKIGTFVFFEFQMKMSSMGSIPGADAINIAGFPFPIVGDISTAIVGQTTGLNLPGLLPVTGRFDSANYPTSIIYLVGAALRRSIKHRKHSHFPFTP